MYIVFSMDDHMLRLVQSAYSDFGIRLASGAPMSLDRTLITLLCDRIQQPWAWELLDAPYLPQSLLR